MVMDGHSAKPSSHPEALGRRARFGARRRPLALAIALVCVSLSGMGFLMFRGLQSTETNDQAKTDAVSEPSRGPRLFHTWPADRQPDVVLLLSGEVHGYMQPCGCSEPQYGGLERRYNFVQGLTRQRGWPIVAVDVGDVAQRSGPQALLKYKYTLEAMKRMRYTAVGIGLNEMSLPLIDALGEFALDNASPRIIAANLANKKDNFPKDNSSNMVESYEIAGARGLPKVGVVGAVGPSVAKSVNDPMVKFEDVRKTLEQVIPQLQKNQCELLILLYQGSIEEAKRCAEAFPEFQVIQCLTREEEPPGQPQQVGNTIIVEVGHKGRYVGLIGAYRGAQSGKPFELFYQLAELGPEYKTPEGKDADNPILALFENYSKDVKKRNYLSKYPKAAHPIQQQFKDAKYVGSEKCKKCHEESYEVWKNSPHSHAYASLQNAKRPSLRQYDGECIVCHVTGFEYESGFMDEKQTPQLINNGCENCHGPASLHVKDNYNNKLNVLMNPYKTQPNETEEQQKLRLNRLDASCQKCHDIDNDVHWKLDKWIQGHIVHKEPK
jgi:Cytochrome c554 and c-prime